MPFLAHLEKQAFFLLEVILSSLSYWNVPFWNEASDYEKNDQMLIATCHVANWKEPIQMNPASWPCRNYLWNSAAEKLKNTHPGKIPARCSRLLKWVLGIFSSGDVAPALISFERQGTFHSQWLHHVTLREIIFLSKWSFSTRGNFAIPREYLAISEDILGCHNWDESARNATKQPTVYRKVPTTESCPAQRDSSSQVGTHDPSVPIERPFSP